MVKQDVKLEVLGANSNNANEWTAMHFRLEHLLSEGWLVLTSHAIEGGAGLMVYYCLYRASAVDAAQPAL